MVWLLPAVLVFAAGFVVGAFYDLPLNEAVYNPTNPVAIVMEGVGWLPVYLPPVLLATLLASHGFRRRRYGRALPAVLVAVAASGLMLREARQYFVGRGIAVSAANPSFWVLVALWVLLFGAGAVWVCRLRGGIQQKLFFFSMVGCVYLAANQLLVNGLKLLWQRTRFDDMLAAGALDAFTPWYVFGNGGSSFPSGHTASAAGVFLLLVCCDLFPAWNRRRKLVYGICWAYIAFMAVCRIAIGRHFLSDTLAAAGLMALLFFALHRFPVYQKLLSRVRLAGGERK